MRQTTVMAIDGWTALKAVLPPKERRGVVLIDPPFEEAGEIERLLEGLREARKRFATGIYLLWHPIKDPRSIKGLHQDLGNGDCGEVLAVEHYVRAPLDLDRLNGAGLVIVNPPYRLAEALGVLLPVLATCLAQGDGARAGARWLFRDERGG